MGLLTRTLRLPFIRGSGRPVFSLTTNGVEVVVLYDSGAVTPVWAKNERMLKEAFPLVEKQERTCLLSGFGKGALTCAVYKIPEFSLGTGENCYVVRNLPIILSENPSIGCDMIFSATMFAHADVTIRQREERSITFIFDKEVYYSAPLWSREHLGITTWTQEEPDEIARSNRAE